MVTVREARHLRARRHIPDLEFAPLNDIRRQRERGSSLLRPGRLRRANPSKLTVLAEEALPMTSVDAATLEQRIKNPKEILV